MKYSALVCISLSSIAIAASGCSKKGAEGGALPASEPRPAPAELDGERAPLVEPSIAQPASQRPDPKKDQTDKTRDKHGADSDTEEGFLRGDGDDNDDDDQVIEEEVPAE